MRGFSYCIVLTMLVGYGCAGSLQETVTCNPAYADIYWGKTEFQLKKAGYKTPYSRTISGSNLESWCYQVKKEGYQDSEIVCREEEGFRYLDFHLVPLKLPKTTASPNNTKLDTKRSDSTIARAHTKASEAKLNTDEQEANAVGSVQPKMSAQQKENVERKADSPDEHRPLYPYSVYLGSFKTIGRAENALSIYKEKGLDPYWVKVDLGSKGVWFRVFAGYFQKRDAAEAFIRRNNLAEAESRHTKYANLIGIYELKEGLETARRLLLRSGYFPYIIQGNKNNSFLYSGAFSRKVRAEKEHRELASKGIQSKLVER